MLEHLDKLAADKAPEPLTAFIAPRLEPDKLETVLQQIPAAALTRGEMYDVCAASPNGAVIFWGGEHRQLIAPPFPLKDTAVIAEFSTEHLKAMLNQDYTIGVALIRLGTYALGVCKGDKLISRKIGTGLVHARHRQGGSSSRRFERHRDKQMETFFNRVAEHTREQFEPYARTMDYLIYGGAWETVQLFIKYCPYLTKLNKPVLPTLSDIHEPKGAVLEKTAGRIYSSKVWEWEDDKS
jgi:peptide chain release factor subunit 1